jgi:chemotaxis response regulator CheB
VAGKLNQWYRSVVYGTPVVVVSGLPRSGTSMAMKMLEAGGIEVVTDGARTADVDNPKGYYEDDRVLALAKDVDKTWLRGARGRAVKIISYLLRHLPEDNNYKVVFMRRDISEVLASQAKMLERRGEAQGADDATMREFFEADLWKADYHIKRAAHIQAMDLHYTAVLEDPVRQAEQMAAFLGRDLDIEAMATIVDPDLYRNRS